MELKDEYIRNYVFEPEFLTRKDSIHMHKDRLLREQKREQRQSKRLAKSHSLELEALSEEEVAMKFEKSIVDAEVYSFCTVNIETPRMSHAFEPWKCGSEHLRDILM